MKTFAVHLHDSQGARHFPDVVQFIAADGSGSFGLLAGHAHLVAVLRFGLARFLDSAGQWRYLALPGGVLTFSDNHLKLAAVRCLLGTERGMICRQLEEEMARSDSELNAARTTMDEIENTLVRRLVEMSGRFQEESL